MAARWLLYKEDGHTEEGPLLEGRLKEEVLQAGLQVSSYVGVDDTGARHQGHNGSCLLIGHDLFACVHSSDSIPHVSQSAPSSMARRASVLNHQPDAAVSGVENTAMARISRRKANKLMPATLSGRAYAPSAATTGMATMSHRGAKTPLAAKTPFNALSSSE